MKALSIRAPWWWFILHGGKDIENRDWPTKFRGTVYIHASKWWKQQDVEADALYCQSTVLLQNRGECLTSDASFFNLRRHGGHIVGTVDIVDCVTSSTSPWFFGKYGFVLANPKPLNLAVPCKGALGLFTVPDLMRHSDISTTANSYVGKGAL